jgi:hypothetical protein
MVKSRIFRDRRELFPFALLILTAISAVDVAGQVKKSPAHAARGRNVIWRDPGNISGRDLYFGPGSPERAPAPPFTFVTEEKSGESPKIDVEDANGVKWRVKLGPEAQSETVASRLVWAMGYFAEEAYYLDRAKIENLPRLTRGRQYVKDGDRIHGARFEPRRNNVERGDNWDWLKNPFVGTREFNGLKALMVLLANYDVRPENNRIMTIMDPTTRRAEHRYTVSDLGATLGAVGGLGGKRSKNNLQDFRSQSLVKRVNRGMVEFQYRTRPTGLGVFTFVFWPPYWQSQTAKEKAMRRIPAAHVRWIGQMLGRLSNKQLRDAFRAASYSDQMIDGYVAVLQRRINEMVQPPNDVRKSPRLARTR